MGSAASVLGENNPVHIVALLREFETCRAVMTRDRARSSMLQHLLSGRYALSDEQTIAVKKLFQQCEDDVSVETKRFEDRWKSIIEDEGRQFKRSQGPAMGAPSGLMGMMDMPGGDSLLMGGPDTTGDPMDAPFGMPMGGPGASRAADSPAADTEQEEREATAYLQRLLQEMKFNNTIPDYLFEKLGTDAAFPIKLKMAERKALMESYLAERAQLEAACDAIESDSQRAVLQLVASLPPPASAENGQEDLPATDIVWGVSLRFLYHFLETHPKIDENFTTGSVVYDIIIPETAESEETYVNAHLLKSSPGHISDLRKGYRRFACVGRQLDAGLAPDECGLFTFLSHAWSMPFRKLVEIASLAARTHVSQSCHKGGGEASEEECLDSAFFWIDVMCKNQHKPAPAMKEFRDSIAAPGCCVVAMYPLKPLAVSRIWCLYEVWTASVLDGVDLIPTYPKSEFSALTEAAARQHGEMVNGDAIRRDFLHYLTDLLGIDINQATATRPEDIGTILEMIDTSVGVESLNRSIGHAIVEALWKRFTALYDVNYVTVSDTRNLAEGYRLTGQKAYVGGLLMDVVVDSQGKKHSVGSLGQIEPLAN